MSDIRQRAKRKNKKRQIWFSYFLFSTLIVFDIFAILSAIGPLVSGNSIDCCTNNSSMVDLMAKMEKEKEGIMVTLEVLAIGILILFNLVALLGLRRGRACLLVPWMIAYFTGFCASYFRVLLLLAEQVDDEDDGGPSIFDPLATAIIFNIAWLFVCTIFKELIKHQQEVRAGPVKV